MFGGRTTSSHGVNGGVLKSDTVVFYGLDAIQMHALSEPPARHCHAACAVGGNTLCVCGGWAPSKPEFPSYSFLNDVWLLDISCASWTQLFTAGSPAPRCQHALWACGEHVVLFGGAAHRCEPASQAYGDILEVMDTMHVLNLRTQAWLPLNVREPGMRGGVLAMTPASDGSMLFFGGMHSDDGAQEPTFRNGAWRVNIGLPSFCGSGD